MIGRLRGEVIERTATSIVVDVQGVGYVVTVPRRGAFPVGARVDVHVHTHVREDALDLFGFTSSLDREVFHLLIGVPGIGPVKAMGILETPPEELVGLVRAKDLARLSKLPGVGKKTAERLVLDLHEKMVALAALDAAVPSTPSRPPAQASLRDDLTSALSNLGFKPAQADAAAGKALERAPEAPFDTLLRDALQQLTARGESGR